MIYRTFNVSALTAGHVQKPAQQTLTAFGPFEAAKAYVAQSLSGYSVIPGGTLVSPGLWRFEAIDAAQEFGCVVWTREA